MNEKTPDFEEIFHAALEIESAEEREEFLQAKCGDDSQLLSELREMLASHQELGSFLDKPPVDVEATIIGQAEGNLVASMEAGFAPAFGDESAVVIGDANHSVLRSLGNTLSDVPRVSLRESQAEGDDPIARPSSPEMPTGDSDSRYQLQGEIARGGMGAIIKGRDTDLGRDLAIKVLLDSHKDKPEVIQRFVEEAQIGGQLQHPGIAPIYELGQFKDKRPFFAMKLVKGQTLSKLLADREDAADERGRFIGIFEQVCQTMAYAHSRGVIHRDLKPANIMVGAFGEVQVMDWGLAKVLSSGGVADEKKAHNKQQGQSIIQTMRSGVGSDSPGVVGSVGSQTQMGSVMGTPAYMPPEQALGEIDNMDERADVFGLGAILCEILTGKPPYVGEDGTRVFRMASRGKLDDAFSRLDACGADEDLIALTKHCLELEPVDRPRDAGVLAERVTDYLESVEAKLRDAEVKRAAEAARAEEALHTVAQTEARTRAERRAKRLQLTMAAVVAVVATVGGLAAAWNAAEQSRLKNEALVAERDANTAREKEADQRVLAEAAKTRAETAQQQADTEKINSLNMLADMQTERGLLAADEGQSGTAALWFANAAALTPHDLDRQRANHLRASSWLDEAIAPAAFLTLPAGPTQRFEFQPNGPLLLTVSRAKLRVWDWRNEVALPWSEADAYVTDAVWSPDGQQLAAGFGTEVRILDPVSGDVLKQFQHPERVNVLEWSPDGTRLAVGGLHVQIWNVLDEPVRESDWPHPQQVYGLHFDRAGTRLMTSCQDDLARVFGVCDTSLSAPLYAPVEHVPRMEKTLFKIAVFIDQDRRLATVSRDRNAVLYDAVTGQPVTPDWAKSPAKAARGFSVSPDGNWVASAGFLSAFLLTADGRSVELKHNNHPESVSFSPDGQSLVTTCWDTTARWWPLHDMASPSPTVGSPMTIPQMGTVAQCAFSSDSSCLAIVAGQQLVIWERSPSQLVVGEVAWAEPRWKPRPSFDGELVTPGVKHSSATIYGPRGRTLQVARMEDGQPAGPPITLNGLLVDSCVCADNRTVAAATVDGATGRLTVYDIASGTPAFPSIALPDLPLSVAARPEHFQVAVLCRYGKLLVIDTQQGEILLDLSHDEKLINRYNENGLSLTSRVAYSPDGTTLLTVISKEHPKIQSVYVRDAQTGGLRFPPLQPVLDDSSGPCRAIAFSPDSRLLATAVNGKNMVQVWDLVTGEKVGREMPHTGDNYGLFSVAFSPDGQRILTGHKDGNARIWDRMTGTMVGPPMKHPDEVLDAQFTPDGRHVVTAVRHSSPRVWDVATGKPAVPFPQIVPAGASSNSLAIAGDRVVVTVENRYPVVDLSYLRQSPADDLSTLLTRVELATNQKLQHGELVPLVQAEWTDRWEQRVATRQTPEEAAQSLAREFDEAQSESTRRTIAMRAMRFNLTERLQQLRGDDPHLQVALAVEFSRAGRDAELKRILPKAMADGQAALQKTPTDTSLQRGLTQLAAVLADQLLAEAEQATQWRVLKPTEMKSEGGATLTLQADGSILASGTNPDRDAYEINVNSPPQHIKAIRLEAIPDPSLPHNGPGRWPGHGNFHLNEFRVLVNGTPHQLAGISVSFSDPKAKGHYRQIIDGTVDGNLWSIHPRIGQRHSAMFATDLELAADDTLTVELVSSRGEWPQHNLGRFRLSVSDDPGAYANAEQRFAAIKINNPWAKLAVAYVLDGQNELAVQTFSQALQLANSEEAKQSAVQQAALFDGFLEQLADLHPDEPVLQVAQARVLLERGEKAFEEQRPADARADLNRARTLLAATLESNPENAFVAKELAEVLLAIDRTENDAQWTVLTPTEMKSEGGATLTLLDDGSILVSGPNVAGDSYTLSVSSDLDVVTAIRLEVLPDPSLPANGPGRHESGNFHVAAFQLFSPSDDQIAPLPININRVRASFAYSENNASVASIIDEDLKKVWHVWGQTGRKHHADFELTEALAVEGVKPITIVIKHNDAHNGVNLGRFRLLASNDPGAYVNAEQRFAAMKTDDPWAKLAVAYHLIGDQTALGKLLEQHPAAAAGIVELHVAAGDWPQAIEAYSKLITDQTTDVTLLSNRAAAYIATAQWDLAKADWLRVIEQQPDQLQRAFHVFQTAGQWSTAAEFGQRLVEQKPDDSMLWLKVGVIVYLAEPDGEYSKFCSRLTKQFGETNDIIAVGRLIKPLLLNDSAPSNAAMHFGEVISKGLEDNTTPLGAKHFRWGALALLAYRSNDPEATVQFVEKSAESSPSEFSQALNLAVLAMAQLELKESDSARKSLAEASQVITRLKEDPNNQGHHDLLIAQILFREAEAKINGNAEPTKEDGPKEIDSTKE